MTNIKMTGVDILRKAVNLFNNTSEDFNSEFSEQELIEIYKAFKSGGWDITPDHWSPTQVHRAITLGEAPIFDECDRPIETISFESIQAVRRYIGEYQERHKQDSEALEEIEKLIELLNLKI